VACCSAWQAWYCSFGLAPFVVEQVVAAVQIVVAVVPGAEVALQEVAPCAMAQYVVVQAVVA